jgi:hypothetical protein
MPLKMTDQKNPQNSFSVLLLLLRLAGTHLIPHKVCLYRDQRKNPRAQAQAEAQAQAQA